MRHWFAVQHRIQRGGQIMDTDACGDRIVVDPAAIAHRPACIDDDGFRRHLRAEAVGKYIGAVLDDRERQAMFLRMFGNIGGALLTVGVDREHLHIACAIDSGQRIHAGGIDIGDRTLPGNEQEDAGFVGRDVLRRVGFAGQIAEREFADGILRAHGRSRCDLRAAVRP